MLAKARKGIEDRQMAVLGWTGVLTLVAVGLAAAKKDSLSTAVVIAGGSAILLTSLLVSRIGDASTLDAIRHELEAQGLAPQL